MSLPISRFRFLLLPTPSSLRCLVLFPPIRTSPSMKRRPNEHQFQFEARDPLPFSFFHSQVFEETIARCARLDASVLIGRDSRLLRLAHVVFLLSHRPEGAARERDRPGCSLNRVFSSPGHPQNLRMRKESAARFSGGGLLDSDRGATPSAR